MRKREEERNSHRPGRPRTQKKEGRKKERSLCRSLPRKKKGTEASATGDKA